MSRKKKKNKNLPKWFRPAGFLIDDKKAVKRQKFNKAPKNFLELFYVNEASRYDQELGTFTSYEKGDSVKIHLVAASWSRIFTISLLWGFSIAFAKFLFFYNFGKPEITTAHEIESTSR
jgi:hypothetical protein